MPVKADVVRRKLLAIDEAVDRLQSWLPIQASTLARDIKLRWAVERGLQISAEALFDAGSHILAGEFREVVDEYGQIAERLASRGVISGPTAERLVGLGGFRNVLVHDYTDIDLDKLVDGLQRLDDLEQFVADVGRWLDRRGSDRPA